MGPADVDEVGADDVFGVGAMVLTEETDEGFVSVGLFESGVDLLRSDVLGEFDERGGTDAGVDGHEVGDEGEGDGLTGGEIEFLADFAEMAMAGDAVGAEGAVDLTEEERDAGVASGTTGAAHAGDVDGLIEVDETGAKERDEREEELMREAYQRIDLAVVHRLALGLARSSMGPRKRVRNAVRATVFDTE